MHIIEYKTLNTEARPLNFKYLLVDKMILSLRKIHKDEKKKQIALSMICIPLLIVIEVNE